MQAREKQIEANLDKLMAPDTAREFTKSLGIIEVTDVQVTSPNQEKSKAEEIKKAKDMVKKLQEEKKSREQRMKLKLRLESEKFA